MILPLTFFREAKKKLIVTEVGVKSAVLPNINMKEILLEKIFRSRHGGGLVPSSFSITNTASDLYPKNYPTLRMYIFHGMQIYHVGFSSFFSSLGFRLIELQTESEVTHQLFRRKITFFLLRV